LRLGTASILKISRSLEIPLSTHAVRNRIVAEDFPIAAAVSRSFGITRAENAVALRSIGAVRRTTAAPRRSAAQWDRIVAVRVVTVRARGRDIRARSHNADVPAVRDPARNRAKYAVRATRPGRCVLLALR
jgi:hypothetical protein